MTRSSPQEISLLLQAWRGGDEAALGTLMPLVYDELHRLAHRYMVHERAGHTLQTTALVNEAYLRLVDANRVDWQDRVHFFAICANLMRRILVDFARSRGYQKRGGNVKKVSLEESVLVSPEPGVDLVKLNDALNTLTGFDPRKAKVVELRFFGGLSEEEAAEVLKVSRDTVKRDWRLAKVWLLEELSDEGRDEA
ncbi:MAG: sigma-70 family RNA polymerase sigma factor [Acidobacteriia bacterium]|nr:sigma-70 family RNA polymerase sigma factor [Terriglobia bacterium]